jgi:hypothetical protein
MLSIPQPTAQALRHVQRSSTTRILKVFDSNLRCVIGHAPGIGMVVALLAVVAPAVVASDIRFWNFEPKVGQVNGSALLLGKFEHLLGILDLLAVYLVALLLHLFERAEIVFTLTREAALLNAEIAERALIGDVDL